jgi:hypothetical protein
MVAAVGVGVGVGVVVGVMAREKGETAGSGKT